MYIEPNTIPLGAGQQITVSGGGSVTPTFGAVTQNGADITSYDITFPTGGSPGGGTNSIQINNGSGGFDGFWEFTSSTDTINSTGNMTLSTDGTLNFAQNTTGSGIVIDTSGYIGIGANGGGIVLAENSTNNYLHINNDGSVELRGTANKLVIENTYTNYLGNNNGLTLQQSGGVDLVASAYNLQVLNLAGGSNGMILKDDGSVQIHSNNSKNIDISNSVFGNGLTVSGAGGIVITSTNSQNVDITGYNEVNLTSNHADMTLTSNGNSMHLVADHEMTIKGGSDGESVYMENVNHSNQFKLNGTGSCEVNSMNNGHVYVNLDGIGAMFVKGRFSAQIQTVTMTTGGSVTSNGSPTLMLHTATGSIIATYTVNFPTSPVDGQYFCITTDTTVTTLGLTVSGTSFVGTPTTITAFTPANFQWSNTLNKWLRV